MCLAFFGIIIIIITIRGSFQTDGEFPREWVQIKGIYYESL